MIRMIVSGGQTGVDRAALDFAIRHQRLCTGWCPKNRLAEDGAIPPHYPLIETVEEDYEQRTEWNIRDTDGTLVILQSVPDDGTRYTIEMAYKLDKPFYMHDLNTSSMPDVVGHWLKKYNVQLLNIAGPRESISPGIYQATYSFLEELFAYLAAPEGLLDDEPEDLEIEGET